MLWWRCKTALKCDDMSGHSDTLVTDADADAELSLNISRLAAEKRNLQHFSRFSQSAANERVAIIIFDKKMKRWKLTLWQTGILWALSTACIYIVQVLRKCWRRFGVKSGWHALSCANSYKPTYNGNYEEMSTFRCYYSLSVTVYHRKGCILVLHLRITQEEET